MKRLRNGSLSTASTLVIVFSVITTLSLTSWSSPAYSDTNSTKNPMGLNFAPTSFHMIDAKDGWTMATVATAVRTIPAILRTADGGATWYNVSPSDWKVSTNSGIETFFSKKSVGWVAATTHGNHEVDVFYTTNSGRKWVRSSIALPNHEYGNIINIQFVDRQHGWITVGVSTDSSQERSVVDIFHSSDSGKTWKQVSTTGTRDFAQSQNGLPINASKMGVSFMSPTHGWATVYDRSNGTWLYRSQNSGTSWMPVHLTIKEVYKHDTPIAYLPCFFSKSDGAFGFYHDITVNGATHFKNALFLTHDAGHTWHETNPVQYNIGPDGGTGGQTQILDMNHAFIIGGKDLFVTTNGGISWVKHQLPTTEYQVDFINSDVGWATNGAQVWKTTNQGKTWTVVNTKFDGI